ncbi:MAG: hypothetical protein QOK28_344 [Actinomycetota bacterium]|jgi:hypothetical protein
MLKGLGAAVGLAVMLLSPHAWTPKPTARPESVTNLESGVWWIGQPKVGPALPPPQQVPANGLWVSSTPAGTVAVSAVRFAVGANDRQPILDLPVEMVTTLPAEVPADFAVHIVACPAASNWQPPAKGTFGALSAAPKADCGKGQVLGALSLDGKTMVFELGQFVTETNKVLSVVLTPTNVAAPIPAAPVPLPIPIPNLLMPSTFDVTFKPVTTSAVEVLTSPASDDEAAVQPDETSRIDPEPSPSYAAPTANTVAPTPRRSTGVAAVPRQLAQATTAVVHTAGATRTRTLAAVVFFDLCLWAWWASNRDPLPGTPQAGRPYRTLYDGGAGTGAPRRRLSTLTRVGKPPPLR